VRPGSPEDDFVRYREHADLSALARVFDALAGHLLLVAGHLVRDGALAEDLVQTTFVEAMRSASRYEARRPLLPWLVRILTHHAHKLRRQRSRSGDPRSHARDREPSAASRVMDREFVAAVERALGMLPLHYRQALTLRLVHDMPATAIAHALGCPPETVKTRLRRGFELLRTHLPRGIATAVAMLLGAGRGLAAVRADVLAAGAGVSGLRAAAVAPLVWIPLGVMLMKKYLLGTAAAVALGLLCWVSLAPRPIVGDLQPVDSGAASPAAGRVPGPLHRRGLGSAAERGHRRGLDR
jgi:RNA polymerase sigma-70 factor (ECF subfamily)